MQQETLQGPQVTLDPMLAQHVDELSQAAQDGELWKLWFTGVAHPDDMQAYVSTALQQKDDGLSLPYVVRHNDSGKLIGSSRICNRDHKNNRLEIGYTWYSKSFQRTAVNTQCKYLLLNYAFENLGVVAVEFRTHWMNHASRNAIARLGAKQDGVLRRHVKMPDGTYRDTVVFSILDGEWPAVKSFLQFKMEHYG